MSKAILVRETGGADKLLWETLEPGAPGPDPHGCLPTIMAIAERYPELKAQESFLSLQSELASTEQRVALVRAYYNNTATFHNTRMELVPDQLISGMAGLKRRELIQATGFEPASVPVDFTP